MAFPTIKSSSLAGQPFHLPGDWGGRPTVLPVGFHPNQQLAINNSIPYVKSLGLLCETLCY